MTHQSETVHIPERQKAKYAEVSGGLQDERWSREDKKDKQKS